MVEVGFGQHLEVAELFELHGYSDVEIVPDLAGIQRVVKGMLRDA
jgi:methylase of polypeptide subunit release factors